MRILLLFLAAFTALAQIPGTFRVTGPVAPPATNSNFGATLPVYGTGGLLTGLSSLSQLQDLNRYPLARRHAGMKAVLTNGEVYQLDSSLTNWFLVEPSRPQSFGAKGDGVTDDSAAFAAMLAVANTIEIPAGTYRLVTTNIPIQNSNVRIYGKPGAVLTMDATNLMNSMFYATNKTGIEISDLAFSVPTHRPTYVLRADLTTKVTFKNCMVTNMGSVLTRGYVNANWPDQWTNIANQIASYETSRQSDIKILDNTFIGSFQTVPPAYPLPSGGVQYAAAQLNYTQDVLAQGNVVKNYGSGIFQAGGMRMFVETNGIASFTYTPTSRVAGTAPITKRWRFISNSATNCQAPFWIAFASDVTFNGNTAVESNDAGFDCELSENVTFVGNAGRDNRNGGIMVFDYCNNITIVGNSLITTEYGATNFPPGSLVRFGENSMSTNVVIADNNFSNLSSTNTPSVILGNLTASIVNLTYNDNNHFNVPVYVGRTSQGLRHSYKGNTFVHTNALPDDFGALTINYSVGTDFDLSDNKFSWAVPYRIIESAAANVITFLSDTTDTVWGGPAPAWQTGTPVQYVANNSYMDGVAADTVYYVNRITDNTYSLYDTEANAIAGGATGLIPITTYTFGTTFAQIIEYKNSEHAIKFLRYTESGIGGPIDANVVNNRFDWPKPLFVGAHPTFWDSNKTNATADFLRNIGPIYVNFERNKMSGKVLPNGLSVRADMLGFNGALFHGENRTWIGQPWPQNPITNTFVLNRSVWYDTNWVNSANSGMIANRNGFWVNSLGETAWASGRNYTEGDLVQSSGTTYACVVAGTSSVAPTGPGNADGIIWDGTLTWVACGSFFQPMTQRSIGQLGFRQNAGTPYNVVTPGFLGEELFDSSNSMWWKSTGSAATSWRPNGTMAFTETITPDVSDIVVAGRKGAAQLSYVDMPAGTRTLRFTTINPGDGGTLYINPDASSRSLNFASDVFSPNGASLLTVPGGTGGTNAVVIDWRVITVGGSNRIWINPSVLYKP